MKPVFELFTKFSKLFTVQSCLMIVFAKSAKHFKLTRIFLNVNLMRTERCTFIWMLFTKLFYMKRYSRKRHISREYPKRRNQINLMLFFYTDFKSGERRIFDPRQCSKYREFFEKDQTPLQMYLTCFVFRKLNL